MLSDYVKGEYLTVNFGLNSIPVVETSSAAGMLASIARQHIRTVIGNGETTFLWFDIWHPKSPLLNTYGHHTVAQFRSHLDAEVNEFISNDIWCWPAHRRTTKVEDLIDSIPDSLIPNPNLGDQVVWDCDNTGKYSLKSAILLLKEPSPKIL
ncbi:hypothetical protein ACH5RR_008664 [Cinchona calisaya]|uniref:Uncharacterized protein n=1 Tax=Cinchona calisaya TaxID=153742 RepID=A0ABD3AEZ5_9GENT